MRFLSRSCLIHVHKNFFCDKPKTIPPAFKDIKEALDDAKIYSDLKRAYDEQVQWPTPAHHQIDEAKTLFSRGRPWKPKRGKFVAPHLVLDRDDSEKTVIIFPGQGSQFVGMGSKAMEKAPATKDLFQRASAILGYDLLKLCLEGPKETLDRTEHCQAAIMVSSLAAVEALWEQDEDAVKNCVATAGFSVGEITALVFGGALSFEDGVRLVHVRGQAMQHASELVNSGMMTIFFNNTAQIGLACEAARKWVKLNHNIEHPVCVIANHLYAGGKVLAGHVEALEFIDKNKADFGIRRTKMLPVSGAFHTQLMKPATEVFQEALGKVSLVQPRIPVYSNVDGVVYQDERTIGKILPKQITNTVKWEQIVCHLMKYSKTEQLPRIIECGPGSSLTSMLKNINAKWAQRASVVSA